MATLHADPLSKGASPSRPHGKMFVLIACFIGTMGCIMFLSQSGRVASSEPSISMALHMQPVQASEILAALPGPSALKNRALAAIEARNGRCLRRDVSVGAAAADVGAAAADEPFSKEQVLKMAGVSGPLGFFDPLGIATKVPQGRLLFYREAELKHGRVCMLAFLGLIVAETQTFVPLLGVDIPAGTPAYLLGTPFVLEKAVDKFWPWVLFALFVEEVRHEGKIRQDVIGERLPSDRLPGDYGWDPLGLRPQNANDLAALQTKELNNGRLAMFGVLGILAQEALENRNILR